MLPLFAEHLFIHSHTPPQLNPTTLSAKSAILPAIRDIGMAFNEFFLHQSRPRSKNTLQFVY
ncbi:hypothetical protein T4C_6377 [Trichinella pseudospiralis]|uniref:Uncharacterized protein n=1 Tax=Trichinella pseudospiralis TaxID=6337 RepID=A0A0V1GM24_TRIPS|nr:hypothetical protein T4C_6377 [Trichinella pseudospiralis]